MAKNGLKESAKKEPEELEAQTEAPAQEQTIEPIDSIIERNRRERRTPIWDWEGYNPEGLWMLVPFLSSAERLICSFPPAQPTIEPFPGEHDYLRKQARKPKLIFTRGTTSAHLPVQTLRKAANVRMQDEAVPDAEGGNGHISFTMIAPVQPYAIERNIIVDESSNGAPPDAAGGNGVIALDAVGGYAIDTNIFVGESSNEAVSDAAGERAAVINIQDEHPTGPKAGKDANAVGNRSCGEPEKLIAVLPAVYHAFLSLKKEGEGDITQIFGYGAAAVFLSAVVVHGFALLFPRISGLTAVRRTGFMLWAAVVYFVLLLFGLLFGGGNH